MKIIVLVTVPIIFALLLNEVRHHFTKRTIQTAVYLPHFMSWVIMASILIDILSPSEGIVNKAIMGLGFEPIFFLGDEKIFPYVMVITDLLKEFGFESIVFLAALMAIDPTLYEASSIDGANRWQQTLYITLPGISTTIILIATLSMGYVLNAGFDQIYNLYSPVVASTGEIIDTYIFKLGIVDAQYSVATAMGIFRSVVSLVFIATAYKLANKLVGYEIF
jgi:putative aldouronate transport system permease protein